MDTKKDIGTAIKARLDPLKGSPDDVVWTNIEGQLKKKKKRRVLIFWGSGLGLSLMLVMLWIINPFHSSSENKNPVIETRTVDNNSNKNSIYESTKIDLEPTNSTENEKSEHAVVETPEPFDDNQYSESESDYKRISERSNLKTDTQKVQHAETKNFKNLEDNSKETISKNSDPLHTASVPIDKSKEIVADKSKLSDTSETRSTRDIAIAKRDSIRALNNRLRDSIKAKRQSERLVSEEEIDDSKESVKDSIPIDDASKWSITPQVTRSYYGAFNTKTSDNISFNYGVLASYRMTEDTYLRIGLRRLRLNQTIGQTERIVEYLEFPLEIKYVPFSSKFKPYLTSGLSYFKLQSMELSNTDNFEYKATMGINLGLGLETKLFNHIYYNLETNFNYQLKPFTQKNNVNPYILSIHTGLEYRF